MQLEIFEGLPEGTSGSATEMQEGLEGTRHWRRSRVCVKDSLAEEIRCVTGLQERWDVP